ncbi:MAG: hypothetical protein ACREGL_05230 [Alphaproteobacteria bacterium]
MTNEQELRLELAALAGVAAAARADVVAGQSVDLAAIERRAEELCLRLRTLPKDSAAGFRGALISLVHELDRLRVALEAHHAELARALAELGMRHRAVSAYGKPDSPKDTGPHGRD